MGVSINTTDGAIRLYSSDSETEGADVKSDEVTDNTGAGEGAETDTGVAVVSTPSWPTHAKSARIEKMATRSPPMGQWEPSVANPVPCTQPNLLGSSPHRLFPLLLIPCLTNMATSLRWIRA